MSEDDTKRLLIKTELTFADPPPEGIREHLQHHVAKEIGKVLKHSGYSDLAVDVPPDWVSVEWVQREPMPDDYEDEGGLQWNYGTRNRRLTVWRTDDGDVGVSMSVPEMFLPPATIESLRRWLARRGEEVAATAEPEAREPYTVYVIDDLQGSANRLQSILNAASGMRYVDTVYPSPHAQEAFIIFRRTDD